MRVLSVQTFYERRLEVYKLELLTASAASEREITVREVNRPGLCLAGHTRNFLDDRIQILGETEITFLETMADSAQRAAIDRLLKFRLNCIIITKALPVPPYLQQRAEERRVPLLRTPLSTTPFLHSLTEYLTDFFAPRDSVHASLVDVYGVGLLFVGRSGIGKSEIALDLVERGHRLVADDVVELVRKADDVVIGRGREMLQHNMEIRGIGVVDVREIFGIRAIRIQKRIEVVVRLEEWSPDRHYDRHGLERMTSEILDVSIPTVVIPIFPGKNVTVLAEVVALDHMLRTYGFNAAENLQERIVSNAKARAHLEEYLANDKE
ncbi:MAG TPA: HPr(Ser) kinase/phosphatase [Candidatus Krumholzibacteria bacterium]|nr:HPr(Ser) kinase/phosphatase [Candidatus Krumholzibacteria bacterium]